MTASRELLAYIAPKAAFAPATRFVVNEPELAGIPVLHLFRDGRTLVTLLLWVIFFMSLLDIYFLANWLPTVLHDLGASVSEAVVIGTMLQVGGVVGTFALGSIIDRFSFRALALVYFIAVFAVGAIGQIGHSAIFGHHRDLHGRILRGRRPDRRQRAGGGVLPDLGQVDRRRLGARDRPGRLDRRAVGRRRAADDEMEHRGGIFGGGRGCIMRGAGVVFIEPSCRHGQDMARAPPTRRRRSSQTSTRRRRLGSATSRGSAMSDARQRRTGGAIARSRRTRPSGRPSATSASAPGRSRSPSSSASPPSAGC